MLDEFHERSLEMDLVLGLLVRVRQTLRPDLRIAVMSATLDPGPVAALLATAAGPAPVVSAEGRVFPVAVRYLRHGDRRDLVDLVAEAVPAALRGTDGHVLAFLPGVGEIARCHRELGPALGRQGIDVLPLHGELPPEAQDRVLTDGGPRKVILATNVAETSLTIPGVTAVVDSGLARQPRELRTQRRDAVAAGRVGFDRTEVAEQPPRGGECLGRRRVEPGEVAILAECEELQERPGHVAAERLRRLGRRSMVMRRLVPEPQAEARARATGAAGPLLGGRLRDRHHLEPRQAGGR